MLLALPGAALGEELRSCTVDKVAGTDARSWSAGVWSQVVVGLVLTTDAKIATGADSRVRIACNNGTVVTVGTRTVLNLESLVGIGDRRKPVVIQLLEGIVGLVMPSRYEAGFEARTQVGIAAVRGTEWLIEWNDEDGAAVFVRRGEVAVRSFAGGQFVLGEGDGITIAPDGAAGEVKQWGAARITKSTDRLGFDWQ